MLVCVAACVGGEGARVLGSSETGDAHIEPAPSCTASDRASDDPLRALGCERYLDRPTNDYPAVTVRFVNRTNEPLLIRNRTSGCKQPARHFDVDGLAGGRWIHAPMEYCPDDWPRCQGVLAGVVGCHLCDSFHKSILIAPGGFHEEQWDENVVADAVLDLRCSPDGRPHACAVPMAAPAGVYAVRANSIRAATCEWEPVCEEEPDPTGSCLIRDPYESCAQGPTAVAEWDGTCPLVVLALGG